jgi:hypothetical protein
MYLKEKPPDSPYQWLHRTVCAGKKRGVGAKASFLQRTLRSSTAARASNAQIGWHAKFMQ